jgi:hypothetical protein
MNAQSSASGYSFDDEPPLLEGMHHNISTGQLILVACRLRLIAPHKQF